MRVRVRVRVWVRGNAAGTRRFDFWRHPNQTPNGRVSSEEGKFVEERGRFHMGWAGYGHG